MRKHKKIFISETILLLLSLIHIVKEGDSLEIYEKYGEIRIVPVCVYPVGYIEGLKREIERLRKDHR